MTGQGKPNKDEQDRELLDELIRAVAEFRAHAAERHWWWRMTFLALAATAVFLGARHVASDMAGVLPVSGTQRGTVSVVDIAGEIHRDAKASAARIVPLIRKACSTRSVSALVLAIDSTGGNVAEADQIARAITACQGADGKPVFAAIGGSGVSAAYLIAAQADRIIANRFALVGSVGAVITPFPAGDKSDAEGAGEPIASGEMKLMLSGGDSAEGREAVTQLVKAAAREFEETLRARRPGIRDWDAVMSGQTFDARTAQEMGLVDGIGTLDEVLDTHFKDLVPVRESP